MNEWLKRYRPPTKYDIAYYGALCKVMIDDDDIYELYIQISEEEEPHWERLGDLLEKIHEEEYQSEKSRISLIETYKKKFDKNTPKK